MNVRSRYRPRRFWGLRDKDFWTAAGAVAVTAAFLYFMPEVETDLPSHILLLVVVVLAAIFVGLRRLVASLLRRRRRSGRSRSGRSRSRSSRSGEGAGEASRSTSRE
jgi:hypothetical protein